MGFILSFDEKRKFPRVKVNSPITIQEEISGKVHTGHCIDLSATGSRIYLSEPLPENTLIRLELSSPLGLEPFCALARIVYVSPNSDGEVGLEITEILSTNKEH
jgi:PilZ domain